ncbi:uncharacterized protein MONOS_8973 [Monocercomonoides exilis]|uniref:uncharacterized protein n=1 Tax=Monocercomonoides exilis TaxID=2049356 RepID=UPI00355A7393|nr:hypothetical protein MONOS_8973 [Monocercomonoides exilis]|eukprot:MONOS_8973.1-p1 / transcript=MONOS_8973.1 / gene=MONOS_8973 / organism=Monocercomonoides_exilis_PA203 / gene_product=unspecified product / transcript_product=unspecified product / location=Mono_scaffold00354:41763-42227(+) / protein_length=123 / sequence_SO=supercontig / SO=protein_coding / is_pseudo=false
MDRELYAFVAALEAKQPSLRPAPSSSSSSSTGAARRSTSPFRKRRSEEKKATGDVNLSAFSSSYSYSSSAPAIDPSDALAEAESNTSAGAMDDIERRLRIVVPEAAGVYGRHMPLSLQLLLS